MLVFHPSMGRNNPLNYWNSLEREVTLWVTVEKKLIFCYNKTFLKYVDFDSNQLRGHIIKNNFQMLEIY